MHGLLFILLGVLLVVLGYIITERLSGEQILALIVGVIIALAWFGGYGAY